MKNCNFAKFLQYECKNQDPLSFAFDRNLSTTENFTYEKNSKLENYGRESKEHKGRNFKKGIRKSNASKHTIRKSNA